MCESLSKETENSCFLKKNYTYKDTSYKDRKILPIG